jgi:hypothetical protein
VCRGSPARARREHWSLNGERDEIGVRFHHQDLRACGLRVGDRLVLDINGAVVRGDVSIDIKDPWLGTQKVKGWSHRRITDALRRVALDNPSDCVALIVERNGVVLSATDTHELQRRAAALVAAGVTRTSPAWQQDANEVRARGGDVRPKPCGCRRGAADRRWSVRTLWLLGTVPQGRWLSLPRSASCSDARRRRCRHGRQRGRAVPNVPSASALRWLAGSRGCDGEATRASVALAGLTRATSAVCGTRPTRRAAPSCSAGGGPATPRTPI